MQRSIVSAGVLVLCLGCGGADGDRESAAQGWRAASAALESASADFQAQVDAGGDEAEVACPRGGQVRLEGEVGAESFDFTVAFEQCAVEGVVVDGMLSYTGQASPGRLDFEYVGTLEFSGSVEMTCGIDVAGSTEVSADPMNVSARSELRGSICGHSADAVAAVGG